jgi:putative phosphoribosyl transferase
MADTGGWRFAGRGDAGRELARRVWARLWWGQSRQDVLVLGASPGGLVVAAPVAVGVRAELDVVAVCPIASPDRFAHGIGAVTATGPAALVRGSLDSARPADAGTGSGHGAALSATAIGSAVLAARRQARAREMAWRGYVPPSRIAGRTVIVVDDGLGIGVNALAVLRHVLRRRPARLLFATPVCTKARAQALATLAEEVISLVTPPGATMAGRFYAHLAPVSDGEVRRLLPARQTNVANPLAHKMSYPVRSTRRD